MSKHGELKRGQVREDGKIFFRYDRFGNQYWYDEERYNQIVSEEKSRNKLYRKVKRKELSLKNKIYRHNNAERCRDNRRKYYEKNKDRIYEVEKKRLRKKPLTKIKHRIRNLISATIRRNAFSKSHKTNEILNCSFCDFKKHIESQFSEGMNWGNYGKWHIDHIMPVSMAKTYDEVIRLNHYKNLRPMWAKDNLSKGQRIDGDLLLF